jgi:hypothetical protein
MIAKLKTHQPKKPKIFELLQLPFSDILTQTTQFFYYQLIRGCSGGNAKMPSFERHFLLLIKI